MELGNYDFEVKHRKGKANPADALSRLPVDVVDGECFGVRGILNVAEEERRGIGEKGRNGDVPNSRRRRERRRVRQGMDLAKYVAIWRYLTELSFPRDCDRVTRRRIRRWSQRYRAVGNELKLYLKKETDIPIEVLHTGNAKSTVRVVHEEAHEGVKATWERVKRRYEGPQLYEVVEEVVRSCERCQRRRNKTRVEEMRPVRTNRVLEIIGIDAVGPLPPTRNENRYLLVAIDYLSKYPFAKAVPAITTEETINFIFEEIVSRYGCPMRLISDRGSNFTSELMKTYMERLGVRAAPTTSYRPQSNGMVERTNQTLTQTIAKVASGKE
ncbi:uncharacterized protein VTP21DRAFT_6376 [Calcarisporiella thermophila]|uniref:uncharacterized protein n=1 Tax=Calcarisporiella thermophila TaxID=911321 RepID=UPI003743BB14